MRLKIRHFMADGTERESIDGLVIPLTDATRGYYEMLAGVVKQRLKEQQKTPAPIAVGSQVQEQQS
jgi:hypothetical protein